MTRTRSLAVVTSMMASLLATLLACGPVEERPVPWTGEAANTLLDPQQDDGTDDDGTGDDGTGDDGTGDDGTGDDGTGDPGTGDNTPDDDAPGNGPDDTPTDPPTAPDPDGWPDAWAAAEVEMLRLVNEMRTNGGDCPSGHYGPRAPLTMSPTLRTAARLHSEDMAEQDYFSHTSLDGRSPWTRMAEAGYRGQPGAENIAAGNASPAATFRQWVNSDGHCRNMMSTSVDHIGVGLAQGPAQYGSYWTQTFGAGGP